MKEIKEKQLTNDIKFLLWNDKIDILAAVDVKGEISLYRLSWKKIWSYFPQKNNEAEVLYLVWKPDGKALIVSYSTGEVVLIGLEKKKTITILKNIENNPIKYLAWFEKQDSNENSSNPNEKSENDSIYDSPFLKLNEKLLNRSETNEEDDFCLFAKSNLLVMAQDNGVLKLAIYGSLIMQVNAVPSGYDCVKILEVNVSPNFNKIFVLLKDSKDCVYLVTLTTSILDAKDRELKTISIKYHSILRLMDYLQRSMDSLNESWSKILFEMDVKLSKYANKHSSERLASDFFNLLLFGILSNEMHDFLTSDLTEKGFKKMGTTIESCYMKIQDILSKNLADANTKFIYILSELCGLSELNSFRQTFGLDKNEIRQVMKSIGSFFLKSKEVEQVIAQSMVNFKAFFRWLYVVMLKITNENVPSDVMMITAQDINFITEFLKNFLKNDQKTEKNNENRFNFERIAQYLENSPLLVPCELADNEWLSIINEPELLQTGLIFTNDKSASLMQIYNKVKADVNDTFLNFDTKSNELIEAIDCRQFMSSEKYCSLIVPKRHTLYFACLDNSPVSFGLYLTFIPYQNDFELVLGSYFSFFYESNCLEIVDFKFHDENILFLLLLNRKEQTTFLFQFLFIASENLYKSINLNTQSISSQYAKIDIDLANTSTGFSYTKVENFTGKLLSTSGNRKLCVILAENCKSIKIYETNSDDDEDDLDLTTSGLRDSSIFDEENDNN